MNGTIHVTNASHAIGKVKTHEATTQGVVAIAHSAVTTAHGAVVTASPPKLLRNSAVVVAVVKNLFLVICYLTKIN